MASLLTKRKFVMADALQKKRDIELAINDLKAKKEQYEKDVMESSASLTRQREEFKALEHALEESSNDIVSFCEISKKLYGDYLDIIKSAAELLRSYTNTIDQNSKEIDSQKENLKKIEEQKQSYHEEVIREGEKLGRMKADLDIYKKRLEKEILSSGSKIQITV